MVAPRAGAGSHGGRPGGADRAAPGPPGRRPGHAGRARRRRRPAAGARHRPVGGPRPGAAVRDLGAAQGRPLRGRRGLVGPARHRVGGRPGAPRPPLPARLRARSSRRRRELGRPPGPRDPGRARPLWRCAASATRPASCSSTCRGRPSRPATPRRPSASWPPGTPACSPTPGARASCRTSCDRPIFSNRNPQSVPTVLVDGAVAATWRYDGDAVRVVPLRRLHRSEATAVDEEAERLTAFHRDG